MKNSKVVFLCPYPFDVAPGQRFRYEQYLGLLKDKGFEVNIYSFLSLSTYKILYKRGHYFQKFFGILIGFLRRFFQLFLIFPAKFVFVYREAAPIGYPIFEWILAKLFRKKIIYDFDDSIWLESASEENKIVKKLKYTKKVGKICSWSYKVSVGNKYLGSYAIKYNKEVIINPTTIDTNYHNKLKQQHTTSLIIGWTGTHSTLVYLDLIYPILKKLEENYDFTFMVIADKEIKYDLKNFIFKKWSKETEIQDLMTFNIGVMPLTDDEWSKGKCGFKALQYMSLGIPPVISPVGVNAEIVNDGINGFLCESSNDWYEKLALLIKDPLSRERMGQLAYKKVHNEYSVEANSKNFLSLFNK